jgi:hypothetical protein
VRRQDWRGAGLIALPYIALGVVVAACIIIPWFGIPV